MNIDFFKTSSNPKSLDKVLNSKNTISGSLRNETSVTDVNIFVEFDGTITGYNYMYIPDFGRYYFITEYESVRNGLWNIKGHVDVLYTYRTQIRSNTAIFDRVANMEKQYIADGRTTFDAYNEYEVKKFGKGLNKNLSYILVVAGQN